MRSWERGCCKIAEVEFDFSLHQFEVWVDDEIVNTITPGSLEDQEEITKALDAGECLTSWEDGSGNSLNVNCPSDDEGYGIICPNLQV